MSPEDFAAAFHACYRDLYLSAVRRVSGERERLSPETTSLLLHLAEAGPMSLGEMARHFDRAPSTLSAKLDQLEAQGLLRRERDAADARRIEVWLSAAGRDALADALQVLDAGQLRHAASALDEAERTTLLQLMGRLLQATLDTPRPTTRYKR